MRVPAQPAARSPTPEEIEAFRRDGVVCLKAVISEEAVAALRKALCDIFARSDVAGRGLRTDMTAAAAMAHAKGDTLLVDTADGVPLKGGRTAAAAAAAGRGRYLTEIEGGRWHAGLRHFEHHGPLPALVAALLRSSTVRFFMDHLFLKEAGSALRTAFHQDAPYFPFEGEQAAVVPCSNHW